MIIYYRNSPSILCWEIGNQVVPTSVAATLVSYVQRYDHGNRTYAIPNAQGDYTYNSTETKTNVGTYTATSTKNVRLTAIRKGDNVVARYVDIGETTEGDDGITGKPRLEGEQNRLEARRGVWDIYTSGFENFRNGVYVQSNAEYINKTSENFATSQITSYVSKVGGTRHLGGANWIFSDSISHRKT